MRRGILLIVIILSSLSFITGQVPTDGLLFYYPLDGNVDDASGNGEDGLISASTFSIDRFSQEGYAYFNDSDNASGIANPTQYINPQEFTVTYWFKSNGAGPLNDYAVISCLADNTSGVSFNHDRAIRLSPNGTLVAQIYPGYGVFLSTSESFDDGKWHHLAICLSTDRGFELFVDGSLKDSAPSETSTQTRNGYWRFGGLLVNGKNTFSGSLDDIRVYNRALNNSEVQELYYENGIPPGGSVTIGNQVWMAHNLNVGNIINGGVLQTDNGVIEKYCFNDQESNGDIYGGFYQWDEMMQYSEEEGAQGICPDGWHIPTMAEVDILIQNIGGYEIAGGALKEDGLEHWDEPNVGANNSSRMMLLGTGGWHDALNQFFNLGIGTSIPTSTQMSETEAEILHVRFDREDAYWDNNSGKTMAYPVRCLKDKTDNEEPGLIAYYPFNGNADDESGNNHHGTVMGAVPTDDRFGKSNSAYDFEDWDDYIEFADPPVLNTAEAEGITISHWFTMQSLGNDYNFYSFLDSDRTGIIGKFRPDIDKLSVSFLADEFIVEETIIANKWYNLVFSANFNDNTAKVYLNGQVTIDSNIGGLRPLLHEFHVGRHHLPDGSYGWYFNGNIDDVRIYNRSVTPSEVTELFNDLMCTEIIYDTITTEVFDTTYITVRDTITTEVFDTTYITVQDTLTIEVFDTTYVTITDSISVTDTLIIDAVLTGIDPPDNINTLKIYPNSPYQKTGIDMFISKCYIQSRFVEIPSTKFLLFLSLM